MKRLSKVFSGIVAAAMLVSTLGTSAFAAADTDSGFVFPEGFEEAEVFDVPVGTPNDLEEISIPDSTESAETYYLEGETILKGEEGCVADNAFALSSEGGFSSFDDRFDNTVDGVADTYYVPASGNGSGTVVMANVYKSPNYQISLDKISFYIGTPEYLRNNPSSFNRIRVYLYTGFDGDLAKNINSARRNSLGSFYAEDYDWNSWITINNGSIIGANTEYAIVVEMPQLSSEIGPMAAATKGSFGSGTSYIGTKSGSDYSLTDIADDSMRAALNVSVSKYVSNGSKVYSPNVYVDDSCKYTTIHDSSIDDYYYDDYIDVLKSSPKLYWNSEKGATSYNVYRGECNNGVFTYSKIASTTITSYTDASVTSGFYKYVVTTVANGKESEIDAYYGANVLFPSLKAPTLTNNGRVGSNNYNYCTVDKSYGLSQVSCDIVTYDSTGYVGKVSSNEEVYGNSFNIYISNQYEFDYYDANDNYIERYGIPKTFNVVLYGADGNGKPVCTYPTNSVNAIRPVFGAAPAAVTFKTTSTSFRTQITVPVSTTYSNYYILRKEASQGAFYRISSFYTSSSPDKTYVYNDTDIIPGKKYFYAVIGTNDSYDVDSLSDYVEAAKLHTITVPVSATPAKTQFTYAKDILSDSKDRTEFRLIWDTVPAATSYTVYAVKLYGGDSTYAGTKNCVGSYNRYDTVKNFIKLSMSYESNVKGFYFYVVPSINGKSLNGAANRVYFENKMTGSDSKFWISAQTTANSVSLKWNPEYQYDVRIFRMGAGDSVMRYVGCSVCNGYRYAPQPFVDETVEKGETYTYGAILSSVNGYGRNAITDTISAKVVASAKPVISDIQPLACAADIAWGAVPGATRYAIYSVLNGKYTLQGTTTETRFTAKTGLVGGVKYGFLVRAYINNQWTAFVASDIKYAVPYKFISAPSIVRTTVGNSSVTLTWELIEGATKYAVYTYDYDTKKYTLVSNAYTDTTATVSNLTNGKAYGFLVRAYGNGTWSEIDEAKIVKRTPCADTPTVKVNQYENGLVEASWDYVPAADKYEVYTYLNGKYTSWGTVTDTVFYFKDLKPGVKYGFLVRSSINGKLSSFTAKDITYFTVSTPEYHNAYVNVTEGDKCAYLTWENPVGSTRSAVYIYDPAAKKYTLLDNQIYGNSYTVKKLENDKEYGFLVRSYINGAWTSFTADDLSYATPRRADFHLSGAYYYNRILSFNIYNTDEGVRATKYAIYLYRNNKFTLYKTVDASSYSNYEQITDVVEGETLGILVRGYINGAWSDFTDDDILYRDIEFSRINASKDDRNGNRILIDWSECKNATKYAVYTYDSDTEKYSLIGTTEDTRIAFDVSDQPKYSMDYFQLKLLVRPYVNGAFLPFKNGTYTTVYVGRASFDYNIVGLENGFAVTNFDYNSDMTQFRVYVQNKTTEKYELKAQTNGDAVKITGLKNGETYNYVIYGYYNGNWVNLFEGTPKTVTAGMDLYFSVDEGSRRARVHLPNFYSYEDIVEKYAVYTYVNGKYSLVTDNLTEEDYYITGLENGTKYGVLVRAYIDGKWSSFTEDDIRYVTPEIRSPYFAVDIYSDTGVNVTTSNDYAGSYTKAYLYRYDKDTDKYTLIDSKVLSDDGSAVHFFVKDADARSYGYLVRMTDGKELTPFTSYDVKYLD